MSHNHGYGNDPSCPSCRVGAFAAGDARPPMPFGQVMPAGQAQGQPQASTPESFNALDPFQRGGGPTNLPFGTYVSWLAHNHISCDQWSQMTRAQKIQTIRNLLFGDRARDAYNAQFLAAISNLFGVYALTPFRYATASFSAPSGTGATGTAPKASVLGGIIQALTGNVSPRDDHTEAAIGRLSNLVDADCLRSAVNPNIPHVSPMAARPSGQTAARNGQVATPGLYVPPGVLPAGVGAKWARRVYGSCEAWSRGDRYTKLQFIMVFFEAFNPSTNDFTGSSWSPSRFPDDAILYHTAVAAFPDIAMCYRQGAWQNLRCATAAERLLNAIDADCLRAAVNATNLAMARTKAPNPVMIPNQTPRAPHPGGQVHYIVMRTVQDAATTRFPYIILDDGLAPSAATFLNQIGMNCDSWERLTRQQKLDRIRRLFPQNAVNREFSFVAGMTDEFNNYTSGARIGSEQWFSDILSMVDTYCLRAAINPNIPHVSATAYQLPPHVFPKH